MVVAALAAPTNPRAAARMSMCDDFGFIFVFGFVFDGSPHSSESVEFDRMENFERETDLAWVFTFIPFCRNRGSCLPAKTRSF
jgi:hypothetical protein